MNNTVELIHAEFDTAVDRLVEISNTSIKQSESLKTSERNQVIDDGEFLRSIGFGNVKSAVEAEEFSLNNRKILGEKNELSEKSSKIERTIKIYSQFFPFHKFILYSQVIAILEKYNLYLGPSQLYKGDIPEKNIQEMKEFMKYCNELKNRDYSSILRSSDSTDVFIRLDENKPLCSYENRKASRYTSTSSPVFYICAPKKDFKNDSNIKCIGKEIYKSEYSIPSISEAAAIIQSRQQVKDPIILTPVTTKFEQPGFIISTKWGAEANDPRLTVPRSN